MCQLLHSTTYKHLELNKKKIQPLMSLWWLALTDKHVLVIWQKKLKDLPKVPYCSVNSQHKPMTAERRWKKSVLCLWIRLILPSLFEKKLVSVWKKITKYYWKKNSMDVSCLLLYCIKYIKCKPSHCRVLLILPAWWME